MVKITLAVDCDKDIEALRVLARILSDPRIIGFKIEKEKKGGKKSEK